MKNLKKKLRIKRLFLLTMLLIGVIISYKKMESSKIKIKDKEFTNLIINNTYNYQKENIVKQVVDNTIRKTDPIKLMKYDYQKYINTNDTKEVINEETNPIIYLYNTHQSEEYKPSNYAEFSVNPTVIMNNYILEDIFNKNGYKTIVEEKSIKEVLNNNNWNYTNSYKASRIFLEDTIIKYPSLKYFIDIHRDSVSKDKTTITIKDKNYAKVLFIVGLENPKYQDNLYFTERINNKINELYPGLSKGIYKKSGPGVNGIYNQDFSPYTILIEIGGYENTTTEVLNTTIAFSKCFMEVINE
ncbi:MAG: stage II sporulation protein P [Bacilli bacterium]|nr:stage II sporulation protein P [Bacilli bacterium]